MRGVVSVVFVLFAFVGVFNAAPVASAEGRELELEFGPRLGSGRSEV
jgi:hypothetical protein